MAQLSDDCFAFGGPLMTTAEALSELRNRLGPVTGTEVVSLKAARGRILAGDVVSDCAVPGHDNAAVDGYAVFFDDLADQGDTTLPIRGRIAAGHPLDGAAQPGAAYRIFTGAPMPAGADTVFMQEDCQVADGQVILPAGMKRGGNRRFAGEDIKPGQLILKAGQRLRPQELGYAASIGATGLTVYRPLRVALFSTGDEVRDIGEALPPGCIYDSNRYSLRAMLEGMGCVVEDLGILEDRHDPIQAALAAAAENQDVIITSAGVSTGDEDHVRNVVSALGSIHFWRLAIRPGRPLALGQVSGIPFVGLPGNPVAVMITFMRFARPALLLMAGCTQIEPAMFRIPAAFSYNKKAGRREWVRSMLVPGDDGALRADKFPLGGAGILSSMVAADGLVELDEDVTRVDPGDMVDFLPFSEVMT
jgi:molybdopterin molybdotransferase